jgi:ketosteroid isomerase-like protein
MTPAALLLLYLGGGAEGPVPGTRIDALHEMVEAVNAGDAARYARVYAEDAVIVIRGGETLRGRAAVEAYEVGLLAQFPGTRLALLAIWDGGEQVVVHYAVRSPGPPGKESGHEGLLFYRFDDRGRILEERRYLDSLTPMSQVGLLGPARAPLPELPAKPTVYVRAEGRGEQSAAVVRPLLPRLHVDPLRGADATVRELMFSWPPSLSATSWRLAWRDLVADAEVAPVTVLGVGDFVLAEVLLRGRLVRGLGPLQPSAARFEVHRALVARLSEGHIVELTAFMNGREMAESLGQWPPAGLRPPGSGSAPR